MNDIKEFTDKYPWLLMVVPIIIVVFIALFYLSGKHNQPNQNLNPANTVQNSHSANSEPSNASQASASQGSGFNILEFILRLFGDGANTNSQNTTNTANTASVTNTQTQQSTGSTGQSSSNSTNSSPTNSTSQNTSNGQQDSQNSPTNSDSGSTNSNNIQIIFKTPGGVYQTYTPPVTPPVDVTWDTYVNVADRYSIDYPSNWQVIKTEYNGHEGVSLYAPGTDPSDPSTQFIGFGLATYYLLPQGNSQQNTYSYPINVSGINGTMYTQGVLGNGSVAAVFQYAQGSFGMGSSVSDPDFIYIYNYMLQSLSFGSQQ